ncbi:Uu.00g095370.m01.CDS01 [Anthostomella pinea]|uniref:Uu.00g095370.m01.CDS01 n=1 Tax=Anthostomella pinea TaxID=933095 RepID=A0AAI8VT40_9PEZI|nr:Uu.00g095370.m01.CDS01 [Anthostomella pinea]
MNSGVSKARTRRSRVQLSKALQETLLDAVANDTAGRLVNPSGTELPQSYREQSPGSGDPAGDTIPTQARKRRLDTTESNPSPANRARLTRPDTQQPGVDDEKAEQAGKPKPNPPKHPYASFLKDFVEPVHPAAGPASIHNFVSEWLESVGSDREKQSRSDSHLHHLDDVPISRQLARSAPEMGHTRDADRFMLPPTPASTRSRRSYQATEDSASSTASVRHPSYRQNNLNSNGIDIRHANTQLPGHISSHVETLRAERDSPSPSEQISGYLDRMEDLQRGCTEADVEEFFTDTVFPKNWDLAYGRSAGLESAKSSLMSSHLIPNNPESQFKVSGPKPDLLYGYSGALRDRAFTQPQFLAQEALHPRNARFGEATAQGLRFPFFAIEFKAAGGTRGDLWVATNQCAGASSACLEAVNQLNTSLPNHPSVQRIDNLSYCIAMDNNTAQLYVSWKEDDLNYSLQRVNAFLLSDPEHFKNFRKHVRNILDWGKDTHLAQIRDALDTILEENRNKAAGHAKSRQPPSHGSATTTSKKRKSSTSRRSSSRSNSVQGPSGGASEGYLGWDETTSQHAHAELSYPAQKLQSFVVDGDYTTPQDTDGGLVPPEYYYPEDEQQDHGPALASFGLVAEPLASFMTDLSTEEQPTAAPDGYWT